MATARTKSSGSTGVSNGTAGTAASTGTCVISKDTSIEGIFKSQADVRMDGYIKGEIHCSRRLVMGESGKVNGSIVAQSAVIMGKIDGELVVKESLHLKATAVVAGDITAKVMTVEEGAEFNGDCRIGAVSPA